MQLQNFDPANYLKTEEDILTYLEIAMEGNDPKHIANALGVVARSKGMTEIAKKTGLGRQALYTALSEKWQSDIGDAHHRSDCAWSRTDGAKTRGLI
jgi:probable addiction module antidote protein